MVFRKFLGMIMSVSTLTIGRGAATPRSVVNFSMGFSLAKRRNNRACARPVKPRSEGPDSAGFDHQGAVDHVVQAALLVGEGDHDEADAENDGREDLGEV